jgi:hypothetical protein
MTNVDRTSKPLVERLRLRACETRIIDPTYDLLFEAAREIERLTRELREYKSRAELAEIAQVEHSKNYRCTPDETSAVPPAFPPCPHGLAAYKCVECLHADNKRLREQMDGAWVIIRKLREALAALVSKHEGWQHGMGPCVCAEHQRARELLDLTYTRDADKSEQENACPGCGVVGWIPGLTLHKPGCTAVKTSV